MQRDSPSAAKNAYLWCLNRRYIVHFQNSVSGLVIFELTKSRERVLSTLMGQKRPFFSLIRSLLAESILETNYQSRRIIRLRRITRL